MSDNDDKSNGAGGPAIVCRDCGWQPAETKLGGEPCLLCGGEMTELAPAAPEPPSDDAAVEVWRASDMMQAEVIRALLDSEGIRTAFRSNATWGVHTFTVDGMGYVGILVLESNAKRALEMIEECFGESDEDEDDPDDAEEPS